MSNSPQNSIRFRTNDGRVFSTQPQKFTMFPHIAESWFQDAFFEAQSDDPGDRGARRREILFAVCCAESYIVEWARDVLARLSTVAQWSHDKRASKLGGAELFTQLRDYFPTHNSPGLRALWVDVPAKLRESGKLPAAMETSLRIPGTYSDRQTADLKRLVDLRNHVTHADLSLPQVLVPSTEATSVPRTSAFDLLRLPAGWATRVVAERIRELNEAASTQTPAWALISTDRPELE